MPKGIKTVLVVIITTSIMVIAAVGFFSPPNNKLQTESNLQAYVNPVYGMKILYPAQWQAFQMGKGDMIVGFISYPQNESGILDSVIVQTVDPYYYSLSLQDIAQKELDNYKSQIPTFHVYSSSHGVTSQGLPFYRMEYSQKGDHLEIKTMEILVKNSNYIYRIVYNSDASEYPLFVSQVKKMIDSMGLQHQGEHAQQISNYYRMEAFISI